VPRSEKFIKKNFMGYEFLHDGYTAAYKADGGELEGFLVQAASEADAEAMLGRLLEVLSQDGQPAQKTAQGFHVKTRYAQHLFIGRVESVLCGAMRVPEGLEAAGERTLEALSGALSGSSR
jgi:hypothetical protein